MASRSERKSSQAQEEYTPYDIKTAHGEPPALHFYQLIQTWWIPFSLFSRIMGWFIDNIQQAIYYTAFSILDLGLFMANMLPFSGKRDEDVVPPAFSPEHPPALTAAPFTWLVCAIGKLAPENIAESDFVKSWSHWEGTGHNGKWAHTYRPPRSVSIVFESYDRTDHKPLDAQLRRRNAMANHGILPRNGRHITPTQLMAATSRTYNVSFTLAQQLLFAFRAFYKDRGWFDIEDLGGQGLIQHDGSMLREDINSRFAYPTVIATQARPSQRLLDKYFPATNDPFGWKDHARVLSHRRQDSRQTNGTFVLTAPLHYIFSSGNGSLAYNLVGTHMKYLRPWLGAFGPDPLNKTEDRGFERFVDGFVPADHSAWGLTILKTQIWTALIEGACGPLDGVPRMVGVEDDVVAGGGWFADLGQAGREYDPTGTTVG